MSAPLSLQYRKAFRVSAVSPTQNNLSTKMCNAIESLSDQVEKWLAIFYPQASTQSCLCKDLTSNPKDGKKNITVYQIVIYVIIN